MTRSATIDAEISANSNLPYLDIWIILRLLDVLEVLPYACPSLDQHVATDGFAPSGLATKNSLLSYIKSSE